MAIFLIIVSILLWLGSFATLFFRQLLAPALSYVALLLLSFASEGGQPLVPVNATILWGWLCMTVVVMVATILQPSEVNKSRLGTGYLLGGALVGLAVGMLGQTIATTLTMFYGVMVIAVAAGTFFGYLLFTNTPAGRPFSFNSGRFYSYLLAKGFPAAISVMMAGLALVITLACAAA